MSSNLTRLRLRIDGPDQLILPPSDAMSRPSTSSSDRPPLKRARRSSSPSAMSHHNSNGGLPSSSELPALSLSILNVEPLDEFIREVADFIHHMISQRPKDLEGSVEVEAKVGLLVDKHTGMRLQLPVLTETSELRLELRVGVGMGVLV